MNVTHGYNIKTMWSLGTDLENIILQIKTCFYKVAIVVV